CCIHHKRRRGVRRGPLQAQMLNGADGARNHRIRTPYSWRVRLDRTMPEASQYTFSHKELLALLVKAAGLHEGKWMLLVTFGFTAGNFAGPDCNHSVPSGAE